MSVYYLSVLHLVTPCIPILCLCLSPMFKLSCIDLCLVLLIFHVCLSMIFVITTHLLSSYNTLYLLYSISSVAISSYMALIQHYCPNPRDMFSHFICFLIFTRLLHLLSS